MAVRRIELLLGSDLAHTTHGESQASRAQAMVVDNQIMGHNFNGHLQYVLTYLGCL